MKINESELLVINQTLNDWIDRMEKTISLRGSVGEEGLPELLSDIQSNLESAKSARYKIWQLHECMRDGETSVEINDCPYIDCPYQCSRCGERNIMAGSGDPKTGEVTVEWACGHVAIYRYK